MEEIDFNIFMYTGMIYLHLCVSCIYTEYSLLRRDTQAYAFQKLTFPIRKLGIEQDVIIQVTCDTEAGGSFDLPRMRVNLPVYISGHTKMTAV